MHANTPLVEAVKLILTARKGVYMSAINLKPERLEPKFRSTKPKRTRSKKPRASRNWSGSKFRETKNLELGQIRWLIEGDISVATHRGELPLMCYEVRLDKGLDPELITVQVNGLMDEINPKNIYTFDDDFRIDQIISTIKDILWEYNAYACRSSLWVRFTPRVIIK